MNQTGSRPFSYTAGLSPSSRKNSEAHEQRPTQSLGLGIAELFPDKKPMSTRKAGEKVSSTCQENT